MKGAASKAGAKAQKRGSRSRGRPSRRAAAGRGSGRATQPTPAADGPKSEGREHAADHEARPREDHPPVPQAEREDDRQREQAFADSMTEPGHSQGLGASARHIARRPRSRRCATSGPGRTA